MANYILSNTAKEDLIRIHHFGVQKFGMKQADKYFNEFFNAFDRIAKSPFFFEAADFVKNGYRRCVSGADSIYFKVVDGSVEVITIIGSRT